MYFFFLFFYFSFPTMAAGNWINQKKIGVGTFLGSEGEGYLGYVPCGEMEGKKVLGYTY